MTMMLSPAVVPDMNAALTTMVARYQALPETVKAEAIATDRAARAKRAVRRSLKVAA
jgi:hypothetical protein